jgi:hypothetical protein
MSKLIYSLILCGAWIVVSCHRDNNYCPGPGYLNKDCRTPIDAVVDCTVSGCSEPGKAVCDDVSNTCVQCTVAAQATACAVENPICGDNNVCRGCQAHSECASAACTPDGSCAAEGEVAYVAPTGTGMACSKAEPCKEVKKALETSRPYVKFSGVTDEKVVVDNQTVTFLADPGAKLMSSKNGILLEIKASSKVSIADLEITGASGMNNPGVFLPPGNSATVALLRVRITNNTGGGLSASGGSLTVSQSTFSGNTGQGLSASGGSLTVSQSTFSGNTGGGISALNTTFDITNNFIFRNGNSSTAIVGGASLTPSAFGTSVFAFNTVVDNQIKNSSSLSGGVSCDTSGFAAANNIVVRNFVNNDRDQPNSNTQQGLCTYPTSSIAAVVTGLNFASPDNEPYNYHLLAGSSAIDQATTASTVTVDIDGDSRPQGGQKDIGADEYKAN